MDTSKHDMNGLFDQLGLDSTRSGIYHFVKSHNIQSDLKIDEAPFWNSAQANFLSESVAEDGDWSEIIDQLDAMLRK